MSADPSAQSNTTRGQEPPPAPRGSTPQQQPPRFRPSRWWIIFFLALLALNFYFGTRATQPASRVRIPYSPFFLDQVKAGHVKQITSKGTDIQGTFTEKIKYQGSKATTRFRTEVPAFANNDALSKLLQEKRVTVNAKPLDTGAPWWQNLLLGFGPTLVFIFLLVLLMRRAGNVQNVLGSFGRASARRYQPSGDRVTFKDVAGIDEAKQELTEVVDFLRQPEKYRKLGGRIPHGVLLSGPPGTGKTLLARAVAGEANAPFFSMAASEFVEAIVGVGASPVRDLFKQAKESAPSIVFIDELDAIGRSRTSGVAGFSGGNDEREQTLNQILTEMDGFDSSTHVIVIAATNRPDVLDPALLRPGRFDRHVTLDRPDIRGRRQILDVHARNKPLDTTVDLDVLARQTPGFSGADLANLINEAAILAARANRKVIGMDELEEAIARVVAGPEKKSRRISEKEKEVIAYHEVGHALVMKSLPLCDPVHKVSIISRGMALGWTLSLPEEDKYLVSKEELKQQIAGIMGGRAAEEIVFGDVTSGAENDIQQATQMARRMITRWGMGDKVGTVQMGQREELVFLGRDLGEQRNYSEEVAARIDSEIKGLIAGGFEEAKRVLSERRAKMDEIVERLKVQETIDGAELDELLGSASGPARWDHQPASATLA